MSLFEKSVHRTKDGRVFIWLAPPGCEEFSHDPGLRLTIEPSRSFRISVGIQVLDEDGRLHLHAKFPFTSFVTVGFGAGPAFSDRIRKLFRIPGYESREISLSTMDGALLWNLWKDPDSWSSTDPWWKGGILNPVDILFGQMERTRHRRLDRTKFTIPMPEGDYPAVATLYRSEFTRPRWPFRFGPLHMVLTVGEVEIADGVPFPGKGENSYDCGDDALYSWNGPAESLEDAIGKTIASVLRTRRKRSGSYWFGQGEPPSTFHDYDEDRDQDHDEDDDDMDDDDHDEDDRDHDDRDHDDMDDDDDDEAHHRALAQAVVDAEEGSNAWRDAMDAYMDHTGIDTDTDEVRAILAALDQKPLGPRAQLDDQRDRLIGSVVCFKCVDFAWDETHQPVVLPSTSPGYAGKTHHPDCPSLTQPPENDK